MSGRILYIDDEEDLRTLIQTQLLLEGYTVDVAGDGKSALAMILQAPYDVVLLDLHLPDMIGPELLEDLNLRNVPLNVIVLSGDTSEDARVKCKTLGVKQFLHKPFHYKELASSIQRALSDKIDGHSSIDNG